ncbi:MAG: hypothetical protein KatS3mg038_2149 [Candidatus Kapaibacterium sp.]|nr:MAG: hypothetical protein KatS3mg038_2149 [Candidatus Kapabacteria bacterium]
MPCEISTGYQRKQCANAGGVRAVYVANYSDVASITLDTTNKAKATAITMLAGKKFYRIGVEPEVANFSITREVNPQGRTMFYSATLNLSLPVQNENDVNWIDLISRGVSIFIVEMNDGTRRIIGHEFGCTASGDESSGTAFGDPHVANLAFTTKSAFPPPYFTGTMPDVE